MIPRMVVALSLRSSAIANAVILADDPAGRTLEVTTRNRWINFNADGVAIQGFIMKHSGK